MQIIPVNLGLKHLQKQVFYDILNSYLEVLKYFLEFNCAGIFLFWMTRRLNQGKYLGRFVTRHLKLLE